MLPLMTVGALPRQHPHRLRAGVLPCLAALLVGLPGFAQAPPDKPVDTSAATPADRSVEELARAAKPAIVTIRFRGRRGGDEGLGTGFFVGAGLVATNLHDGSGGGTLDGEQSTVVDVRNLDILLLATTAIKIMKER